MFNRKLKKRIKSLEYYLGMAYSPKDGKDDYDEHVKEDYGIMHILDKVIEKYQKEKMKEELKQNK